MKKILQKFKNIFKKKAKTTLDDSINPHKHWIIALWVFLAVIVCLIFLSFYVLFRIKNEEIFQASPTLNITSTPLRDDALKNVTATFDAKAKKESDLKTNPPTYKDPSL